MNIKRIKYTWHEFFPEGTCLAFLHFRFPVLELIFLAYFYYNPLVNAGSGNYGAIFSLWLPMILVCLTMFISYGLSNYIFSLCSLWRWTLFNVLIKCLLLFDKFTAADLFYGLSNLVFYILNFVWWCYRRLWSVRRGNPFEKSLVINDIFHFAKYCIILFHLIWNVWAFLSCPST